MHTHLNFTRIFLGNWKTTERRLWDRDPLDVLAPAMFSLGPNGVGQIAFIAVEAQLAYRVVMRDGLPGVKFSFQGFDEGDDSPFVARPEPPTETTG
jgi:hypothetical protein